uniref:Putative protease n=1 Tax=viral metagenome TaxID=1070528 RepID=A0A6M3LNC3_9ZZZZ
MRNYIYGSSNVNAPNNQESPSWRKVNTCEVIDNRIYFYSEIEREDILRLNRELRQISNQMVIRSINEGIDVESQKIWLHINSFGGGIFIGLSAMDEILKCQTPVFTVIDGCCASAATFLSVVGKKRFIHENAFILIHQLSSCFWGKYNEFQDEKQNLDKLMEVIKNIYTRYTKLTKDELDGLLKHDLWYNAEEAIKFGLADEVL